VPALRAIRRLLPEHQMVLGCPPVYEPLLRLAGCIDQVHPMTGLGAAVPAALRPDVAVNLHGRGPQSSRLLAAMQPRRLVTFGCEAEPIAGPRWRADEHEVARWCRLVAESFGADVDPGDLLLARPAVPASRPGRVVVHPGAAHESRRWPTDRYAAVASWAQSMGRNVVVTGSAAEHRLAQQVAGHGRLPASSVLAGELGLSDLAAVVCDADLVVCGDTGVAHLATAFRTPSVVLFGPTPPSRWGPPPTGPHVALWRGTAPGDPWADTVDPALLEITTADVVVAAERLLASVPAAR
jgi:hypothetical protein